MNATQTEQVHCFEAAGLGKAPFRYAGMVHQDIRYGMAVVTLRGHDNQLIQCETKPGGTCDYCGTYIVNMFRIESADGNKFKVGCDCVAKTGDSGLIKLVKKDVAEMESKRRKEKKAIKLAEDTKLCMETDLGKFNGMPHPTPYRAEQGETMGDWARWMRDNKNFTTLAATIRRLSK